MRKSFILLLLGMVALVAEAQKKPLDPSVYDSWQSIGERLLSPDGKWLVYTVVPQEGDGKLVVRSTATEFAFEVPRGAQAEITADSRRVVFHIKPFFKDSREARIRKKTPEQSPKDSIGWLGLGTDSLVKAPRVKSFQLSENNGEWLAYLLEKAPPVTTTPDSLTRLRQLTARADSLARMADSLRNRVAEVEAKGWKAVPGGEGKGAGGKNGESKTGEGRGTGRSGEGMDAGEEGTDLVLLNLRTGAEKRWPLAKDYLISAAGNILVVVTTRRNADSASKALVLRVNTATGNTDTVMRGFHEVRNLALDETGAQLAFVAERDSALKALVKFYRLWYYTPGMDSAVVRADRKTISAAIAASPLSDRQRPFGLGARPTSQPIPTERGGFTVSPDFANYFSKDGNRLFLGLAPIRPPKDTNLVDFETARLDVWNYKDDYLSPQQLVQLNDELKRSYLAMVARTDGRLVPLADANCETVFPMEEGNGRYAMGRSSRNYRIRQQWEQSNLQDIYLVDMTDGSRRQVAQMVRGGSIMSPGGKFISWYDWKDRNWYTYGITDGKTRPITKGIRVPLYDEEDDHPDEPPPHGQMAWQEGDRYVYIYDKYDVWQCDPEGKTAPVNFTHGIGRRHELTFRYVPLDPELMPRREARGYRPEPVVRDGEVLLMTLFNQKDMSAGHLLYRMGTAFTPDTTSSSTAGISYGGFIKAKHSRVYGFLKGSYDKPYDVWVSDSASGAERRLSAINPQQASYNWFTVELHQWKMLDGKMSEGLLYKPEDFDSTKKYPVIFYFYERDARTRYDYIAPQPIRASINVAYFVSNGYVVFDPDIYYKTGQPGEDAYNSVISAARWLMRQKWVDSTKMGLQGHSWGGYQVAYLVTRTHLFAAAEAGAPVANMTSAYGGIRWESGVSRQFQYEKTQSRIGATLWQRPDLYIKNSPLFRADKVATPLLMMHNDADGAVPWYQGIEYFSALRRLGKKAWLIEYNGEGHGLTERRNRKDWSMRLSQFFGYYLKGEAQPRWMTEGVPATLKGIDWGLGAADQKTQP